MKMSDLSYMLETRSSSALFKRAEQLKRWDESETNRELPTLSDRNRKIKFTDGCVFLAACASGDKEEIKRLLENNAADVDTANIDGLTALHQGCIDDNLEIVEFLVEHGADVNRGDNEGWTPLHATASCGFLSIAKYLIENGADVAAVNNDAELPIDIAESEAMEELLQQELNRLGIDCEAARNAEEYKLLQDCQVWLKTGEIRDVRHPKTQATALHVAAAKGYVRASGLLIDAGVDVNAVDIDGWTPFHAAAHWAQRDVCEVLAVNMCDMDIRNYSGQTAFEVAESELIPYLEELRKRQNAIKQDRLVIKAMIESKSQQNQRRRTSITRMSGSEKNNVIAKDTNQEREKNLAIREKEAESREKKDSSEESSSEGSISEEIIDVEKKNRTNSGQTNALSKPAQNNKNEPVKPVSADVLNAIATSGVLPRRQLSQEGAATRTEPQAADDDVPAWRRLRKMGSANAVPEGDTDARNTATAANRKPDAKETDKVELRKPSLENEDRKESLTGQNPSRVSEPPTVTSPVNAGVPGARRSFVPPARDEESETQRKAHAKRVRETRRSTQGVTLEDLKSAEQFVKQQTGGKPDEQAKPSGASATSPTDATATIEAIVSATVPAVSVTENQTTGGGLERRPSWRIRVDNNASAVETRTREQNNHGSEQPTEQAIFGRYSRQDSRGGEATRNGDVDATVTVTIRSRANSRQDNYDEDNDKENDNRGASPNTAGGSAVQRRKRPKRRSTGVVHVDLDEIASANAEDKRKEKPPETETAKTGSDRYRAANRSASTVGSSVSEPVSRADTPARLASRAQSENDINNSDDVDYKKLYEELKGENDRLKEKVVGIETELKDTKSQLDRRDSRSSIVNSNSSLSGVTDQEKRERRALERKISEMEEELKQLENFKTDNQRLRDENGALIRVISKLSK